MKYLSIFLFAFLGLLLMQCNQEDINADPIPDINCENDNCQLPPRNAAFGFKLFQELHEAQPAENIFISPFSVSTALAMATNGAAGQTETDMRKALQFEGLTLTEINPEFKALLEALPALDPQVIFLPANSIWYKEGFEVRPPFLDTNSAYYSAEISELDFYDPASVDIINAWVADKTNGLITSILDQIPADAVMYLMNAVYFKGAWKQEFDPDATSPAPFFLADGTTVNADMMSFGGKVALPYLETENFQAVDLSYGDSVYSMTLLLPDEDYGLDALIADLSWDHWQQWTGDLVQQDVVFSMPKFEMKYETSLNNALIEQGMGIAFSREADFSNITQSAPLQISQVRHKAFVEVTEEGTEAAAVTSIEFVVTSVQPTPVMTLNRPFLFVIRENKTGSVLFMGKMMNPEG